MEFPDVTVCNLNPLSLSLDDYDWEGDKPWKFDQYQDFVISNYGRPEFQYAIQATLRKLSDDEFKRLMGTYASMPTYFQVKMTHYAYAYVSLPSQKFKLTH